MTQYSKDFLFQLEQSIHPIILADITKKRICYWNPVAENIYGLDENTFSLEEIFRHHHQTLLEMIQETLSSKHCQQPVGFYPYLCTQRPDGSQQFVDFTISYGNPEKTLLQFHFALQEDRRQMVAKELVAQGSKASFLAELEEDFPICYGNDLFYKTFSLGQDAFEQFYQNSFIMTLVEEARQDFFIQVRQSMKQKLPFRKDVQVSTVHGVKKWFLLELRPIVTGQDEEKLYGSLLPIADRIQVAHKLEHMNRYLETIQELTTGALFYLTTKGRLSHHSNLLKTMGFPPEMDQFPKCVLPMIYEDDCSNFLLYADRMLSGSDESFSFRYNKSSTSFSWVKMSCLPIRNEEGAIMEFVGRIENIDNEVALLRQATIDPLTGAMNKECARENIEEILSQTPQNLEKPLRHALFFMDLDNFKYVNDNLGHKFGDYLLAEFGRRVGSCFRSGDIIGRVGGDEFIFLVRNIPNMAMLMDKATRLLDTIGEEFQNEGITHRIGGSIGIAVFPDHGKTYDTLYHNADIALYRSKHRGKNIATIYKETQEQSVVSKESE